MRRLLLMAAGGAVGYVLGARAGRPAYDRIMGAWHRIAETTGLTQTAETMSSAAQDLGAAGQQAVRDGVGTTAEQAAGAMDAAAARLRDEQVDLSDSAVPTPSGSRLEE